MLAATLGYDEKTRSWGAEGSKATVAGRYWPPKGVTWPVPPIVSTEQLGGTGPALAPVT